MTLLDVALTAYDAGAAVLPPEQDGTKRPMGKAWKEYQTERPTREQVTTWYSDPNRTGIGFIGGAVSNGLELFEFEGRAIDAGLFDRFVEDATTDPVLAELIDRIIEGWSETTPSGGLHLHYFCDETGCVKLAKNAEGRDLIETKGEGGYMIGAPSSGTVHPTGGSYGEITGSFATAARITPEERELLHAHARGYSEVAPKVERTHPTPTAERARLPRSGDSWFDAVVDDYNSRITWDEVLSGTFEHVRDQGDSSTWHYIGQENKTGATTNALGTDTLIVFSGTANGAGWEIYDGSGPAPSYDRFSATALIDHHDDRTACAKTLRDEGYGPEHTTTTSHSSIHDLNGPSLQNGTKATPPPPPTPPKTTTATTPEPEPHSDPWPILGNNAYLGPIGNYVRAAAPHTEADPVAILMQLLVGIGCLANRGPYVLAGNDRHTAALFAAIVGDTSRAKKGTSWAVARSVIDRIDPDFADKRILGGFGSGEVLIETLAGTNDASSDEPASRDVRAIVHEGELASIFKVAAREASTLGQTIRNAWDGKVLAARTRGRGTSEARDYHASIVGHITAEELATTLNSSDTYGGTTNRFLWCLTRRANILPEGGNVPDFIIEPAAEALSRNLETARRRNVYQRTNEAKALWADLYHQMAADSPPGLLGAATARAESQVLRLSLAYAISCGSENIDVEHIEAAWALWSYCRASCEIIFPATTSLAERILAGVQGEGPAGMSRTSIHSMLSGHVDAAAINNAVAELLREEVAVEEKRIGPSGKGRRAVYLVATEHAGETAT